MWKKTEKKKRNKRGESVKEFEGKKGGKSCNWAAKNDSWKEKGESADVCICSSCSLNGSVAN